MGRGSSSGMVLQWGRVLLNAEMDRQRRPPVRFRALQWGRVLLNAEIMAAFWWTVLAVLLQWGRVLLNAEIAQRAFGRAGRNLASMGPRSVERGNLRFCGPRRLAFLSFNGAAFC